MSCLAIYTPSEIATEDAPATIPFPKLYNDRKTLPNNPIVDRARLIHNNRCCPECNSAAVSPLELNDCLLNASLQSIPGTATVVAFHCNSCYHQWSAK